MAHDNASMPPYDGAQKTLLMDWAHRAFFDGWRTTLPLSSFLEESIERLRNTQEALKNVSGSDTFSPWFVWEGDTDDFLEHLYYSGIPGCVPFDSAQTARRYVEVSFGTDAVEYLESVVQKRDFQSFSHYLAACGFHSKRLKRFTVPLHLELLAKAALTHPWFPSPTPAPSPPPMKTKPGSRQGDLF